MSHGKPPSQEIRLNFAKVTEIDKCGQMMPHQKCIHCKEDSVNLIGQLKDHLLKCKKLPVNIKKSKIPIRVKIKCH